MVLRSPARQVLSHEFVVWQEQLEDLRPELTLPHSRLKLLELLSTSEMTPRLRVLDLSHGVLRAENVDALLARANCFRHLDGLDLSHNMLDERSVARVYAELPNARLGDQRLG